PSVPRRRAQRRRLRLRARRPAIRAGSSLSMPMIVAVSVDMEGASQLRSVHEIWGCLPEYWETGKPRLEADVSAACEGLLDGAAADWVWLDTHGGNTVNVSAEALPAGARLETCRDFDLRDHGVDAMFQV